MFFWSGIEGQTVVFLVLAELYLSIDKGLSNIVSSGLKLKSLADIEDVNSFILADF